jgi:hypothetical protein
MIKIKFTKFKALINSHTLYTIVYIFIMNKKKANFYSNSGSFI